LQIQATFQGSKDALNSTFLMGSKPIKTTVSSAKATISSKFDNGNVNMRRRGGRKEDQPLQKVNFGYGLRRKSRSVVNLATGFDGLNIANQGFISTPVSPNKQTLVKRRMDQRPPFLP
jgi:hypothetical protein